MATDLISCDFGKFSLIDWLELHHELLKIDTCFARESVQVLALRLRIFYSRSDWNEMKAIARNLSLVEPSNPQWPFSDGYATAKIDSLTDSKDQNRN